MTCAIGAVVSSLVKHSGKSFEDPAFIQNKEVPVHRWVNWIAGFSGAFVASCISRYLPVINKDTTILDPFAGVGTTLVEGLRYGANVVGFEINPFAALVADLKLRCMEIDPSEIKILEKRFLEFMRATAKSGKTPKTCPPQNFRSRIPFFSEAVLQQILWVMDFISQIDEPLKSFIKVAFGSVMVSFSNYTYEPSLGSRPAAGKPLILDASVAEIISAKLKQMQADAAAFRHETADCRHLPDRKVYRESFFRALEFIEPSAVDLVVTSPPYMNNYHYVRNTRPQLFWLEFVSSPAELRTLEKSNFGKSWQAVRDKEPIAVNSPIPVVTEIVEKLRNTAQEKGAYGGPGWANYVACYFNDAEQFLKVLADVMRPGGTAVIVIGNSIIQGIEVEVDVVISILGEEFGLETEGIYIIRGQRTGSSIVGTGYRKLTDGKPSLYDAAVVLKKQ
ncbi:MAG: DNA methyltransferase [Bacillota bacterium]